MSFVTTIFVFVLVWWVTLFAVLPMGVESQQSPEKGFDSGAPAKADIWRKVKINTLAAIIVTAVIWIFFYFFGAAIEEYYIEASGI